MAQNLENWEEEENVNEKLPSDLATDPMQALRQEVGYVTPMSGSYTDEDGNLGGVEIAESETNLHKFHFKTREDAVEGEDFFDIHLGNNYAEEMDIDPDFEDNIENDQTSEERLKELVAAFGNRESGASNKEQELTYSLEEFSLMEKCSRYMASISLPEKLEKNRPMSSLGVEMTDEQIAKQVAKYKECENNKSWGDLVQGEIEFIRKCVEWNRYYQKVLKAPKFVDNSEIDLNDIKNIAEEYNKFRTESPQEFAEMKVQKGEWEKNELEWVKSYYKDIPQWQAYNPTEKTEYLSNRKPAISNGEFYYKINGEHTVNTKNGKIELKFVNIRYPTERNVQISEEKKHEHVIESEEQEA